jgi:hypothetical protein
LNGSAVAANGLNDFDLIMSATCPNPPVPPNPPPIAGSPRVPKKGRWFLYGCGGLLALLLLIVVTVAVTLWWIQRPIKPVVLTAKEQKILEQKLQQVEAESSQMPSGNPLRSGSTGPATNPGDRAQSQPEFRPYIAGAKEIRLTEREINGLLNKNTELGKSVRLEFEHDAVNAYVAVPIPQDFPVGGGKMFRARGRFAISIGNEGTPYAVLEDVTVFGVSLPKAWLGGLKGENLLRDAVGQGRHGPVLRGIKSLRVDPGALVLELED